jgi:hypothetical protein
LLAASASNPKAQKEFRKAQIIGVVVMIVVVGILVILLVWWLTRRPKGSTCSRDHECKNGACGRESAAPDAPLVCCASGKTTTYAFYDYCTGMPDGSVCWSDAMCAGGTCKGNLDGLQRGVCTGNAPAGASCSLDEDCKNRACGRKTAEHGAPLICCPSGDTDLYAGYDYCTEMPNGSVCWSDAMCAGGTCKGNAGGLQRGTCTGDEPVGSKCTENADCKNGACGRQTAQDGAPLICCPSGHTDTYGGYDYCTEMPDGSVCWSDAMCAGGTCKGNAGGFQKGTCTGNVPVGGSCSEDADCRNRACGRKTAAPNEGLSCCASGHTTTYAGYDYCTDMPAGSICWSDAMCASGNCKGNAGGFQRGKCT